MAPAKKYKFKVIRRDPSHFVYTVKRKNGEKEKLFTNKDYTFTKDDIVYVTSELINTKQLYGTLGIEFFVNDVKADEWEIAVPTTHKGKKVTEIANFNMDHDYIIEEKTRLLNAQYKIEVARIAFEEE